MGQEEGDSPAFQSVLDRKQEEQGRKPPSSLYADEVKSLEEIDLDLEMSSLLTIAREMLIEVREDREIPANQRAQVLNAARGLLKEIKETRTEIYDSERMRRMEQAIIRALKPLPVATQQLFFEQLNQEFDDV